MEGNEGSGRSRRQKKGKQGVGAALEKLKALKGGKKNKYEVEEMRNVYEEVDEREYSKQVKERQEDDWIVDDDGGGYVEDGREIFDDDLVEASNGPSKSYKGKGSKGQQAKKSAPNKGGSIKNMLMNMPTKKRKERDVNLAEDDLLLDIMKELHDKPDPHPTCISNKPKMQRIYTPLQVTSSSSSVGAVTPTRNSYGSSRQRFIERPKPKALVNIMPRSNSLAIVKKEPIVKEEPPSICDTSEEIEVSDSFPDDFPPMPDLDEMDIEVLETQEADMAQSTSHSELLPDVEVKLQHSLEECPCDKISGEADMTTEWETTLGSVSVDDQHTNCVNIENNKLPLSKNCNGEEVLQFYWIDAYEDYFRNPGIIYLFGKVWIDSAKTHVSCCVTVRNIDKRIYLLPRETRYNLQTETDTKETVGIKDVYEEFNSKVAEKLKILKFKSRKVIRNYAFDKVEVPNVSEYLEVKYSASYPAVPEDTKGQTFSHVFGTNTSSLEMFLLDRSVKGPCWLEVKNPQLANPFVSWCKVEADCMSPGYVTPILNKLPPPLILMALSTRTVINPKALQSEIIMAGCLVHHAFHIDKAPPQPLFQQHFCVVTMPSCEVWPYDHKDAFAKYKGTKLEKMNSERAFLLNLLAKIHFIDPDIIVGHDVASFDLDVIIHRMNLMKIASWSKLGRLKRTNIVLKGKGSGRSVMAGRLICDVKISAKELIRAKSYDLSALCQQVLKIKEEDVGSVQQEQAKRMLSSSGSLLQLVTLTMQDALFSLRLMCELSVLPLALQITCVVGNLMSRTLLGGRSERNEYLLLHAFHKKDFVVPDKQYASKGHKELEEENDGLEENVKRKKGKGKRKPAYVGGLVLEPKRGFYDKFILLMDFNSLYPSIIQEYNICFTTVPRVSLQNMTTEDAEDLIPELPDPELEAGILATEIRKLVESRREVKKLLKNPDLPPDQRLQYNIRQQALKLTANSLYGCLGFSFSRFYAKPLAAMITAKGREILLQTKELVQKMNLEVIYGDTDSIMINSNCTDYDQVFKLGNKIKLEVNKLYKHLELDIDGVFKYMLLLKKKKYAAVTISRLPNGQIVEEQELKGLDIVRRDWSQISADAGRYVLSQILSDQQQDKRLENIQLHLEHLKSKLEAGNIPIQLLAITKQLTKNPQDYSDKKSLPHVQVALRINSKGGRALKQGDTVPYVICEDGSNLAPIQRAYHVDEIIHQKGLKVDVKYYLSQQIHPVVSRLCDPIEGMDAGRVADCLGLDPSKYQKSVHYQREDEVDATMGGRTQIPDEEKYKNCERFTFKCMDPNCHQEIVMDKPTRGSNYDIDFMLSRCSNPKCETAPWQYVANILNMLSSCIKKHIQRYYVGWLICEDPACPHRTRKVPMQFARSYPVCSLCEKAVMLSEYSDLQLYQQLCFYRYIFDYNKAIDAASDVEKSILRKADVNVTNAFNKLKDQVHKILKYSAYNEVDLGKLFSKLFPTTPLTKAEASED